MIISHNREKLINSIIYFAKNTQKCGKTKLFKLLYFLDFTHFRQTGRSVTGLDYYTWPFGPVPKQLYSEMEETTLPEDLKYSIAVIERPDQDFIEIKAKKRFDDKYFTKRELQLLKKFAFIFKEADVDQMTEVTHLKNSPWEKTKLEKSMYHKIDYYLALDESNDSLPKEIIEERIENIEEIKKMFSNE